MRRIAIAATVLVAGLGLAACSSSSSKSASPSTSTPTTTAKTPPSTSPPTCASIQTNLTQLNYAVIAIALKSSANHGQNVKAIHALASAAKVTTDELASSLHSFVPANVPIGAWADEQRSYLDGLSSAASGAGGTNAVNTFNSSFEASPSGKSLVAHTTAIKLAIAKVCSSGAQG